MGYSDEDHLSKTHLYEVSDTDSGCFSNIVGQANFAQSLKRQLPTVFHFLIGGGGRIQDYDFSHLQPEFEPNLSEGWILSQF